MIKFKESYLRLLLLIEQHQSVTKASKQMGISITKARKMIKLLGESLGGPVIHGTSGGRLGGGTTLTEIAQTLITEYREKQKK
jgi:molybdate transport system regulatory protein